MKKFVALLFCSALLGCGALYVSPSVQENTTKSGLKVQILALTAETAIAANLSSYAPKELPRAFYASAGVSGSGRTAAQPPASILSPEPQPQAIVTRVPSNPALTPYTIGVGDRLLLATRSPSTTVEQLTGLLAAENSRQGYTVHDDGTIAVPSVGRVSVLGLTLAEVEEALFSQLLTAGFDPSISVEITKFGSKRVTIGGAVANPSVLTIGLQPLKLLEALQVTGGVTSTNLDLTAIRIYRDGTLYQMAVSDLYDSAEYHKLRLIDGDVIFVDVTYDLDRAKAFFEEQIEISSFRRSSKAQALTALNTEIKLRRSELQERRANFDRRVEFGAVDRDYVYLTGEVSNQSRFALPFNQRASLADVLYGKGGYATREGNPSQIYVLRGSDHPSEFSGLTAYQLDARNATNLLLATRFEMRPNDIIFIAEQPVTRWNRVVSQITPTIISSAASAVGGN